MQPFVRSTVGRTMVLEMERDSLVAASFPPCMPMMYCITGAAVRRVRSVCTDGKLFWFRIEDV